MERWKNSTFFAAIFLLIVVSTTANAETLFGRGRSLSNLGTLLLPGGGLPSGFLDLNQFTRIGFAQLLQKGGQLFENSSLGNVNKLNIQLAGPFRGRLFGQDLITGLTRLPEADTIRSLREFFLGKFDELNSRDQQIANLFLGANGGLGQGFVGNTMFLDVATGVMPDYAKGNNNIIAAMVTDMLNAVSTNRTLMSVAGGNIQRGLVGLNLLGFFSPQKVALMAKSSYSCGNSNIAARLDEVADEMTSTSYYQMLGIPKKLSDFERLTGTQIANPNATAGNGLAVSGSQDETLVGTDTQRLIKWQPMRNLPGGTCFWSYDASANVKNGAQGASRDIFQKPLNREFDAGEGICTLPNGEPMYLLYDKNGNRLDIATPDVALAKGGLGPLHRQGVDNQACRYCHNRELLAGGLSKQSGRPYTENFFRIPDAAKPYYTTNGLYRQVANIGQTVFRNAAIAAKSFINDPARPGRPRNLLVDLVGKYRDDVLLAQAGREFAPLLGFIPSAQQVQTAMASLGMQVQQGGKVHRRDFASRFCQIASRISGNGALARAGGAGTGVVAQPGGGVRTFSGAQHLTQPRL